MDKNSNVGTQYIICECGDNFPNEKLLNIHLANDHGGAEVYQCDACSEYFSTKPLLHQHRCNQAAKEPPPPPKINKKPKNVKTPPVIKLRNLKRIDSISLIQSLKNFPGLIKLEPAPVQDMEYQVQEEPSQVLVKSEVQEQEVATEEIYYQCDVCNTIFYTELEFNVHYQSTHAMKVEVEQTPEQILEDHLVSDHSDNVNVKAEVEAEAVDTAYYYECEMVKREPINSVTAEPPEVARLGMELKKEDDSTTSKNELNIEVELEINTNEKNVTAGASTAMADTLTKVPDSKKKAKKKETKAIKKPPDPKPKKPQIDVYANMPEGITEEEANKIAEERLKEIKREKWRQSAKKYREKYPEKSRQSAAKYASSHREVKRKASAKYAKNHPEVNRKSSAKYSKSHPEVGRNSSAKYMEKKKIEKLYGNVKPDEKCSGNDLGEIYENCLVNEYLCIEENQNAGDENT